MSKYFSGKFEPSDFVNARKFKSNEQGRELKKPGVSDFTRDSIVKFEWGCELSSLFLHNFLHSSVQQVLSLKLHMSSLVFQ